MTLVEVHRDACSFQHDAFIYGSDESYTSTLVPLLDAAVEAGDTVLAVVPRHNADLLRSAARRPEAIEFIAAEEWYDHPVETIVSYERVLRDLPDGTRAFVIGEVQFGVTEADWIAWTRYEAAIDHALGRFDARVVCPYDSRSLSPAVIADARRTHPHVLGGAGRRPSADYVDVATLFATLAPTVCMPTTPPVVDMVVAENLRAARQTFADVASTHGLAADRIGQLTLAVNELLTNAVLHGGGSARLRLWVGADELVCAVEDSGSGIDDPLVGYTAPPVGSVGGYGTWLARRLFERTEFSSSPTGGLAVLASTSR